MFGKGVAAVSGAEVAAGLVVALGVGAALEHAAVPAIAAVKTNT